MAELTPRERLLNLQNFVNNKIGQNLDLTEGVKALAESGGSTPFDINNDVTWTNVFSGNQWSGRGTFHTTIPDDYDFVRITFNVTDEPSVIVPRVIYENYTDDNGFVFIGGKYVALNWTHTTITINKYNNAPVKTVEYGICNNKSTQQDIITITRDGNGIVTEFSSDISEYDFISLCPSGTFARYINFAQLSKGYESIGYSSANGTNRLYKYSNTKYLCETDVLCACVKIT